MTQRTHLANRFATALARLFGGEAGAGILLILVAAAAVIIANSPLAEAYRYWFYGTLPWTPIPKLDNLHLWINDGLMVIFFFVVGLEIKREVISGELSDPAKRRLPIVAAVAGMAVPALVFMAIAGDYPDLRSGWAIPAATDIAFALGVLGLLGKRVPVSLRLFLLTVAIIDDVGAVTIIALFYTAELKLFWLGLSAVVLAAMIIANRAGSRSGFVFVPLILVLWYCVLHSGVHATIAGVAAALTIPMRLDREGDSLLLRMEHALVPWNAYLVVPVFGFANAGVSLAGIGPAGLLAPLPLGIAAGLLLGKQIGILGAVVVAEKIGYASRPAGASLVQLWGTAALCGIGFTMSLFIGALAFPDNPLLVEEAKLGVLTGSLLSALVGYCLLRFAARPVTAPA